METSLHRELKTIYAGGGATEVTLDGYRIDAVVEGRLIEIQHASLASFRDKIRRLLKSHQVLVVKPIIMRKRIIKRVAPEGEVAHRRFSPKRGTALDLFDDLVYFTRVFPHENLEVETPLVDVEEWRIPGHGRRRRHRANDFEVEDQKLLEIHEVRRYHTPADLLALVPPKLKQPFHTGDLAEALEIPRWNAQRVAYCLRETGAIQLVGKQGNALMYEFAIQRGRKKKRRRVSRAAPK